MSPIPNFFPGITHLSERFSALLLDAYGVFWRGNGAGLVPGSKEVMKKLMLSGKVIGILSNATQLSKNEIHKLHQHDLVQGEHFHFLITSGDLARRAFLNKTLPFPTPKNRYRLFNDVHPRFSSPAALFEGSGYQEADTYENADFIYLSVPHIQGEDQIDPEAFRKGVEIAAATGLPVVCANSDRFAHEGNPPRPVVRQGSIAKLFEEMGSQVCYIGKPYQVAYAAAMHQFHEYNVRQATDILMVGDTPETDIRGARNSGLATALVTQTGVLADKIAKEGLEAVMQSLPAGDLPEYFIGGLSDDL